MQNTQREEWNNWYVLKARGNVVITTHTYTPNWMAKMGVAIERACDLCEEEMGIQHIL
jgi:hypothetical protein